MGKGQEGVGEEGSRGRGKGRGEGGREEVKKR